jgi:CDP-paratose 2-epimerase
MPVAIITGSCGLVGSEASLFFAEKGFKIAGIDNDLRRYFFGDEASTFWNVNRLKSATSLYEHNHVDIRNLNDLEKIFARFGSEIGVVIHCAAQPSHDWAAKEPFTDFSVNATGTINMLELTRRYCPHAVFIFTSTNKVYGDTPNRLPLTELETRWELAKDHPFYADGIDETMSIDSTTHSLFGASKAAADLIVQEYGHYFGMKTVCFRGGCLTGPASAGAPLHGFLSYLVKCAIQDIPYQILGYKGKQVRDNIHSYDLVQAFWEFYQAPRSGEVYNLGGGRASNCSILEAIPICEQLTKKKMNIQYVETSRKGDHIWWISDLGKFRSHYPSWKMKYNIETIISEIFESQTERLY